MGIADNVPNYGFNVRIADLDFSQSDIPRMFGNFDMILDRIARISQPFSRLTRRVMSYTERPR